MKLLTKVFLAVSLSSLLLATALSTGLAAPANKKAKMDTLIVKITKTSVLWGKVKVSYKGKTCNASKCSYKVPAKTKVTLTETPTNKQTWPFKHWTLNGKTKSSKSKLSFKMTGKETAVAVYVFK
ncbi:MAG TPA: hypothetical protein VFB34_10830 [Chloroflexota bacterium]|nr:hypothetical protein [Chloroflexota bacterium]